VSALIMIGEIALLNRIGHERGSWRELFGVEFPAPNPKNAISKPRNFP